ncbi:hypothetical protein DSY14_17070 [Nocardiopsis sp. MG754419]|nr:hypothetical protein [Nocardiopsis sp. MG754419]
MVGVPVGAAAGLERHVPDGGAVGGELFGWLGPPVFSARPVPLTSVIPRDAHGAWFIDSMVLRRDQEWQWRGTSWEISLPFCTARY